MKLFFFFFKKRTLSMISMHNWKLWIIDAFLFFVYIFLSYKVSSLLSSNNQVLFFLNHEKFIVFLFLNMLFTPFLMKLFLSGLSKYFFLSKHYPLKKYQLVIFDLSIFGFLKIINIGLFVSLWIIYFNDALGVYNLIDAHIFLFLGVLFAENIVNSIYFKKTGYFIFLISGFLLSVLSVFNYNSMGNLLFAFCNIIILFLFAFLYFWYYDYKIDICYFNENKYKLLRLSSLKILLGNRIFVNSLSVSLIFKVLAFIYLASQVPKNSFEEYNEIHKVFLLLSLPITSFTFVYNNVWGYFKTTAKNLIIATSSLGLFLKIFLKLIWLSVFLDFIISVILLIAYDYFKWSFILWFMFFSIYALNVAFIGSFIKYLPIDKSLSFFSFRRNTSLGVNIITILGVLPFVFFEPTKGFFYLLFPVIFCLISLLGILYFKKLVFKIFINKLLQFSYKK